MSPGWNTAALGEVCSVIRGITFPASVKEKAASSRNVCCLRTTNIQREVEWDDVYFVPREFVKRDEQLVRPGDVLMSMANSYELVGKVAIARNVPQRAAFGAFLAAIRPSEVIETRFLFHWLRTEQTQRALREGSSQTTNIANISVSRLAKLEIPVPPLAEQKRIADKLDRLLAAVDTCKARLDAIPAVLKRFRQSVLAAATSGELTEEFRTNEQTEGLVAVDQLVHRHRRAWADRYGTRRPHVAPNVLAPGDFPRLCDGWSWVRLGILGEDPLAAVQTGPFGALLHSDEFTKSGVPVIAVGNLTGVGFTQENLYFVDRDKADQLAKFDVQAGDLLFARSGATLGKVCVAPEYVRDWRMTGHILRVRLCRSAILPEYAAYCLSGNPKVLEQVFGTVRGMTRPGYNTGLLEGIYVPLPSVAEQQEIVRRVEALLRHANDVEADVVGVRLEKITQYVLAKAFRGELTTHAVSKRIARPLDRVVLATDSPNVADVN